MLRVRQTWGGPLDPFFANGSSLMHQYWQAGQGAGCGPGVRPTLEKRHRRRDAKRHAAILIRPGQAKACVTS
jgi:hypothetical protein